MNLPTTIPKHAVHTTLIAALLAASGAAQAGQAYGGEGFTARAKVLASTPIYETISEPRRECWTETVGYETQTYREGNNTGGAILGAIAGGLIGSTVGKGNGKIASAAVGAASGAVVGDRWNSGSRTESRPQVVERCRTEDNFRQVINGYDVRYRFQGHEYSTRLPYDPGQWVTLNVNFSVADDPRGERWNHGRNKWRD